MWAFGGGAQESPGRARAVADRRERTSAFGHPLCRGGRRPGGAFGASPVPEGEHDSLESAGRFLGPLDSRGRCARAAARPRITPTAARLPPEGLRGIERAVVCGRKGRDNLGHPPRYRLEGFRQASRKVLRRVRRSPIVVRPSVGPRTGTSLWCAKGFDAGGAQAVRPLSACSAELRWDEVGAAMEAGDVSLTRPE
jgi:hypothetical protein